MNLGKRLSKIVEKTRNKEKRFVALCAAIGVVAGLLAVAFRVAIERTFALSWELGGAAGEENRFWLMPLIPALGGLFVGLCIRYFAPTAAGSGIPQTKAKFYNDFGIFRARDVFFRFVLGTLFCGAGNSAGREGPTVHMCSAAASVMAQKCGFSKQQVQNAVPAGMGAGIAASFNAPLSAISFVFEELLGGFGASRKNGGIIIAVVVAAVVARMVLGENPVLPVGIGEFHLGLWMTAVLPIALLSGFAGSFFLKLLLKMRAYFGKKIKLPMPLVACMGGLIVGCMAMFAFDKTGSNCIFSVGYGVLIPAFGGAYAFKALALLFVFKFFATLVSYSMGGSGGLFSPTLVIGGTLGGAVGAAMCAAFGWDKSVIGACVLIGMGSCFASIIRCPITSILMIFELTLNYWLILPLIASNLISYSIARRFSRVGLYDSLLIQDGISLRKMPVVHSGRDWSALPVSALMTFHPETLGETLTAKEAMAKIAERHLTFRTYPVLDKNGDYAGMIDKKSISLADPNALIMTIRGRERRPALFADDPVSTALDFFVKSDFFEVAIVAKSAPKKPVGILTLHDIARYSFNA